MNFALYSEHATGVEPCLLSEDGRVFEGDPNFQRLARVFAWLAAEPGIGVVTGEPGVGETAAMRHPCRSLPRHEHHIVHLGDTTVEPLDRYRMLAAELGLRPGPRAQIVGDIKRALVTLVDERGVVPIIVLDDAQALRDEVLHECGARSQAGGAAASRLPAREVAAVHDTMHILLVSCCQQESQRSRRRAGARLQLP